MKITSKPIMFNLYEKGEFGNKYPCWKTLKQYWNSGYEKEVNFRYRGNGTGKFVYYNMKREEVPRKYCELLLDGYKPSEIHITGGDMGVDRLLNGEIMEIGLCTFLLYSTVNKVMREALKEKSYEVEGVKAHRIINKYMDDPSRKNLVRLLETYPEHVVEFSTFPIKVGELGWNTVFWEVRAY